MAEWAVVVMAYVNDPTFDIRVYDALPKPLRDGMKDTIRNWSAQELRDIAKQFPSPSSAADFLVRRDREIAADENLYGRDNTR